jgi:hypothetical protein
LQFKGIDGISVNGGSVVADYAANTYYASVQLCKNWKFNTRPTKPFVVYDVMPFTVTRANVIGSPTFSSETTDLTGFSANGWIMEYRATITGSTATGYYSTFTVSSNYEVRLVSGSYGTSALLPELCAISNDRNGTLIGFNFNISSVGSRTVVIRYEIIPKGA